MKKAPAKKPSPASPARPVLGGVKPGDVLYVTTPASRYLDEVVKLAGEFVHGKFAGRIRMDDGTGSSGLVAVPAKKEDAHALRAEQFLKEGRYAANVSGADLVAAAKLLGWKEK